MKVILRRLYRSHKITDEAYVYLQILIEDNDWPFEYYSMEYYQDDGKTIEDELSIELDDSDFNNFEELSEENPTDEPTETEEPKENHATEELQEDNPNDPSSSQEEGINSPDE